jgi:transposase
MTRKRQVITAEFKREAVELSQQTDKSVSEIAEDLGIHVNTLYRWRHELKRDGEQAFPGNGRLKADEEEVRRLKRELAVVKQERDILKKAISIFSQQSE